MAYAWEHSDRVVSMGNPAGYLFRVGQSRTRQRRQPVLFPPAVADRTPGVEPALPAALAELTERQRVCTVLSHAYGWTHVEIGELLGLSRSSVQNHIDRGIAHLRLAIGEVLDA